MESRSGRETSWMCCKREREKEREREREREREEERERERERRGEKGEKGERRRGKGEAKNWPEIGISFLSLFPLFRPEVDAEHCVVCDLADLCDGVGIKVVLLDPDVGHAVPEVEGEDSHSS